MARLSLKIADFTVWLRVPEEDEREGNDLGDQHQQNHR